VTATWRDEAGTDIANTLALFDLGTVCQAELRLTAKGGRF
jgi:hypothetical protein